jgi:iron(III) transport system substrate-binding protein
MNQSRMISLLFLLIFALAACTPSAPATPSAAAMPITGATAEVVPSATVKLSAPASTEAASNPAATSAAQAPVRGKLVIYSGRSEPLLRPVIDAFKAQNPKVEILLKAGSNSEVANALIEEKANPQADLFITTEMFTVQSLAQQDIFQPYRPAGADLLPAEFIGPNNSWVGLTRRARVIIYNTDRVAKADLPKSIFDLTDPKWKGKIAAAGSTNGSMQAQIAAMRQLLGAKETEKWLVGLLDNKVTFFGGHTDVRKAVGTGEFALGLVNHYYYHLQLAEGSKVGVIYPDQGEGQVGLITNATGAAVVKGAPNAAAAQAFIDFLISPEGQKLFAEQNYEYPLLPGVTLRAGVQPLDAFRLVKVDVVKAAQETDATFELIEKVGLP